MQRELRGERLAGHDDAGVGRKPAGWRREGGRERGGGGYIRKEEVTEGWRETEMLYNETKKTV